MSTKRGDLTRREAVVLGLSAVAATPFVVRASDASASARPLKVGAIELTIVSDGHLRSPLSFQLPDTPADDIAALFRANGVEPPPRELAPATNVTLVRSGDELVLIDAGAGSTFQATAGKLADNLEAAGVDREKIAKVVFTHGHADHLWGAIDDFDDSERFPNASYVIAAAEWDFWMKPDATARMPDFMHGMARGSARILKRIEGRVERRQAGDEIAPGLTYVATTGHTPGHMAVMVESAGERLLIAGDALTHAEISFQKPDWSIGSDSDREAGAQTRKRLLDRLATDRIRLIGFHLPWPGAGRVERRDTAYRFVAV